MLDAVRAEARKMCRHRATWLMVWIYPVLVTLIVIGVALYAALTAAAAPPALVSAAEWIYDSTILWHAPSSPPGRFLVAGFTALLFAGEYNWNTWKLLIPARARWQLVAAKWVVALGFVVAALIVADIVGLVGDRIIAAFSNDPLPPDVTLGAVIAAHARACAYVLPLIAYTIVFAGLFAILTRSILAAVILSILLIVVEGMLPLLAALVYMRAPSLAPGLVEALPFYHMTNMNNWAGGAGFVLPIPPDAPISFSATASLGILALWIAAAAALTQVRFARQDLD